MLRPNTQALFIQSLKLTVVSKSIP